MLKATRTIRPRTRSRFANLARFLVRGGGSEQPEGALRSRHVVIEFADYATAFACYRSPEYEAAKEKRRGKGDIDLIIVEGYDGAQP